MSRFNTTTLQGRKDAWNHVVHESYLEGHNVTLQTSQLMEQHINGDITIDQVIQKIIESKETKIA